ncbi:DUF262 domain-containing protein [Burkholderia ubonensis]|uniref:DUF262 domain-containing protein n=1 Tax=Burkholderia ubonensis TaxID=101571 RepID=UPI0008FE7037|nr:DUF262 domain-containing protein [Burkholderia ubonensis]
MAKKTVEQAEQDYEEEYTAPQNPPANIVVYNELRSCADLYRLHAKGQLDIKPDFQRDVVWKSTDKTRFIDSLMKQLPIPSMCFGYDNDTAKWMVIDGLQRMSSIVEFLNPESNWRLSRISDVDPDIAGALVGDLRDATSPLHHLYERVENITIPITVLRCDFSSGEHMEYLFKIFHRLNAGGIRLTNQEIRNCIYSGPLNDLLLEIDDLPSWVEVKKIITGRKDRFRSAELILRFFAFSTDLGAYRGNLTRFLNAFMAEHRRASARKIGALRKSFVDMVKVFEEKFLPMDKIGFSQAEALMVAIGKNASSLEGATARQIDAKMKKFHKIELLQTLALSADLSRTESVRTRIQQAIDALG